MCDFYMQNSFKHINLYLLISNKGMDVKIMFHMYILYIQNKYMVAQCVYCILIHMHIIVQYIVQNLLKGNAAEFQPLNMLFFCCWQDSEH